MYRAILLAKTLVWVSFLFLDNEARCDLLQTKFHSLAATAGEKLNSGCSKPKNIKNGIWSCSESGNMCFGNCNVGYQLTHHSASKLFIQCGDNEWDSNPANFRCSCDSTYKPINSKGTSCTGLVCNVLCEAGYSTPPQDQMTCHEETWTVAPESLACSPKPGCTKPTPPENGFWQCTDGDCSCTLSCAGGFRPSDAQEISYDMSRSEWSVQIDTFECKVAEGHHLGNIHSSNYSSHHYKCV